MCSFCILAAWLNHFPAGLSRLSPRSCHLSLFSLHLPEERSRHGVGREGTAHLASSFPQVLALWVSVSCHGPTCSCGTSGPRQGGPVLLQNEDLRSPRCSPSSPRLPGSHLRVLTSKQPVLFPLKENGGKEVLSEVVFGF